MLHASMLHHQKELPNDSERPLGCHNFTDKKAKCQELVVDIPTWILRIILSFIDFQNGANKNQHQVSYQRETIYDKFVIFAKLVRQKSQRVSLNMCVYVSKMCTEWMFNMSFPRWLKMWKVGHNSPFLF